MDYHFFTTISSEMSSAVLIFIALKIAYAFAAFSVNPFPSNRNSQNRPHSRHSSCAPSGHIYQRKMDSISQDEQEDNKIEEHGIHLERGSRLAIF
jgi:hypothetical protein